MLIHLLSGFLGSGKTTAIRQACESLQKQGVRVGVITNDQGIKLVDGYFFNKLGIPEKQVGNGCFCCNYNDLDKSISELVETHQPQVIFAESVGSCTDIVATVMKPLSRYRTISGISLTTIVDTRLLGMLIDGETTFEEDVKYIYFKQLDEAGIIVLNKIDLATSEVIDRCIKYLSENYRFKQIILQNSTSKNGADQWLSLLSTSSLKISLPSIEIDYDQYASGEAKMGYLDQQLLIRSNTDEAEEEALRLIRRLMDLIGKTGAPVGHVKFWVNDQYKLSYTSTTTNELTNTISPNRSHACTVIVNARVQIDPSELNSIMNKAISGSACEITILDSSFFKPGYPKPLHRIAD
jgi:G3E family GTPase